VFSGQVLATLKLHLAAVHLPDQVRACGPAFFCLEYWIERLVQFFKRLIKYRGTSGSERIFVNDLLLRRACDRLVQVLGPKALPRLSEAIAAAREQRRLRIRAPAAQQQPVLEPPPPPRRPDGGRGPSPPPVLLGAGTELTAAERLEVFPVPTSARARLRGLLYLLHAEHADFAKRGWPAHTTLGGRERRQALCASLGCAVAGEPADPVHLHMWKHVRAALPIGENVSCQQCRSQWVKDNTWFLIEYVYPDRVKLYVGQFKYFVEVRFQKFTALHQQDDDATYAAGAIDTAVCNLFHAVVVASPGALPPDPQLGRPPELYMVRSLLPESGNRCFDGCWVVDLRSVTLNLLPTPLVQNGRMFSTVFKASGRVGSQNAT